MTHFNGELLNTLLQSSANHLMNNRRAINDLNVFPVPDGDTGTNMSRTFFSAVETVGKQKEERAEKILSLLASASLRNARGNSGVILSQILRGIAKGVEGAEVLGISELKNAALLARDTAYRAVMKPTEGTILTVVREIAEYAEIHAEEYQDIVEFMSSLLEAGKASLAKTPDILPVLKQAGVVDAGGQGIVTLLEGAVLALNGNPIQAENVEEILSANLVEINSQSIETASIKYLYCTEFIIHKSPNRSAAQFTAAIQPKGDCMLVIEDEEIVKVHIHTNHPGVVLEHALKLGELTDLKIDNMKFQHEERISSESLEQNKIKKVNESLKKYGKVCVSSGEGLTQIFSNLGVDAVVEGGQTMNPSTQDLLNAVESVAAENIYLFPNNKNIILAAEQVQELTDKNVIVLPTVNVPQGISALTVFDEALSPMENKTVMESNMQMVKCSQITLAARDSVIDGHEVKEGQVIGIFEGKIQAVGENSLQVALDILERMIDEDSCGVFIYYGKEAEQTEAEKLCSMVEEKYSDLDVALYRGEQPVYHYIISVE